MHAALLQAAIRGAVNRFRGHETEVFRPFTGHASSRRKVRAKKSMSRLVPNFVRARMGALEAELEHIAGTTQRSVTSHAPKPAKT